MNFSSDSVFKSVSREVKMKVPADKSVPASKAKFDAMLYAVSKAYLELAVKTARAAGCKTVQRQHVKLMQDMASVIRRTSSAPQKGRSMRGGAETVLPSEYFGTNSASYYPQEALAGMEHSALSPSLARAALPTSQAFGPGISMSGGGRKKGCPCMLGGAETVLPSEYFGKNSGAYFDAQLVRGMEHTSISNSVARPALPASNSAFVGGASSSSTATTSTARMPEEVFAQILKEFKQRNVAASDMRFSDDAKKLLRSHIMESVKDALRLQKSSSSTVTPARLQSAAKQFTLFPSC